MAADKQTNNSEWRTVKSIRRSRNETSASRLMPTTPTRLELPKAKQVHVIQQTTAIHDDDETSMTELTLEDNNFDIQPPSHCIVLCTDEVFRKGRTQTP